MTNTKNWFWDIQSRAIGITTHRGNHVRDIENAWQSKCTAYPKWERCVQNIADSDWHQIAFRLFDVNPLDVSFASEDSFHPFYRVSMYSNSLLSSIANTLDIWHHWRQTDQSKIMKDFMEQGKNFSISPGQRVLYCCEGWFIRFLWVLLNVSCTYFLLQYSIMV